MSSERDIKKDITIYTGPGIMNSLYLIALSENRQENWDKLLNMSDEEVIAAFRHTAHVEDQEAFEQFGGGNRSYDSTTSEYYRGLLVLKGIADARGLTITGNKAYEDMDDVKQYITSIFDPMQADFVKKLLRGEASEE